MSAAYLTAVDWESPAAFEQRCARLLPALWLARVDGKSPAEYLVDEGHRDPVRLCARHLLRHPVARLGDIAHYWSEQT